MTPSQLQGIRSALAALAIAGMLWPSAVRAQEQPSQPQAQASDTAASPDAAASPESATAVAHPPPSTTNKMGEQATVRSISSEAQKSLEARAQPSPARSALHQKVTAVIAKLTPERMKMDREFKKAAALFPDFCHEWEQKLRDRTTNNLNHLAFQIKDGWDTATYTGYGKVTSCESHESKGGFAIGKLTYEEFNYYIIGKTEDEAKHAAPKALSDTHTTEIFRWDHDKWFY
jgi:hypothetical protein